MEGRNKNKAEKRNLLDKAKMPVKYVGKFA